MWAGMSWLLSGLLDSFHIKNTVHLYPQLLPGTFPSPTECHIGATGLNHTETTLKSSREEMSKCSITRYSWASVIYYIDSVHIPGKSTEKKKSHLFMHDTDLLRKAGQHCSWTVFSLLTAVSFSATCLISQEPWLWLLLRIKSARKAWGECGAVGIQIKIRKLCIPTKGFLVHVSCKLQHPSRQMGIFNGSFNSMYNSLVSYTLPHLCQPTEH